MSNVNRISPKQTENPCLICHLIAKNMQETNYFQAGPEKEMDVATSAKITKELHDAYSNSNAVLFFFFEVPEMVQHY